jgi:hypothetical protein
MGFLDNSTNNIIIDAVLTNQGRSALANNNGSFKIAFFSLADDEVDYSIIQQYGRTVGKEKIVKNTPIFEAQTAASYALKYRLLTLPDPTIINLPNISLTGANIDSTGNQVTFKRNSTSLSRQDITIQQVIASNTKIPDGTADVTFTVFVPDRFLRLVGKSSPLQVDPLTRIATYSQTRTSSNSVNGSVATVTLELQSLSDTDFTVYGDGSTITTVLSVVGDASGLRKDITVLIQS